MFDLPKYGDGVCLARMAVLLDALAVDRAGLQRMSVVVTGSNGKGSTAAFCAGIAQRLWLADRTVHLAASAIVSTSGFRSMANRLATKPWRACRLRIEAAIAQLSRRRSEKFGAFEAMFALACLYFQESECDFAVFEAGIGGRYDPVRLVGARLHLRDLGRLRACRIARQFAGTDRVRQKRCLCRPAAPSSMAKIAGACGRISSNITAIAKSTSLFVRDTDRDRRRDRLGQPDSTSICSSRTMIFASSKWFAGRVPNQQCRHRDHCSCSGCDGRGLESAAAKTEAAVRSGLRDARWPGRMEVIDRIL